MKNVVRKLGDVSPEEGAFSKLARLTQRFPVIVLMIVLSALFVMSLPVMRLEMVSSGVELLPRHNPQRELFDTVNQRFQYAASPTIQVVASAPVKSKEAAVDSTRDVTAFVSQIGSCPRWCGSTPRPGRVTWKRGRAATVINVFVGGSDGSPAAREVVNEIRAMDPGYQTWTTGITSGLVDYQHDLRTRAPIAILIVVITTIALLFLMTGSVLVPIKALIMNVISLGACSARAGFVFQDGSFSSSFLNFTSAGGIETFIPPLVVAFGFGLAMDYEVFLLSRDLGVPARGVLEQRVRGDGAGTLRAHHHLRGADHRGGVPRLRGCRAGGDQGDGAGVAAAVPSTPRSCGRCWSRRR